ncbi:hypothetical protein MJ390_01070 [Klebsiella pneumoniae]|nr:hypothetical protein MJ390_01070 [Klebsiella pneumoniae]
MTNTHETILLGNHCPQSKKGRLLTPSRYGQPKLAAGKKAKVTVRDITQFAVLGDGEGDVMASAVPHLSG